MCITWTADELLQGVTVVYSTNGLTLQADETRVDYARKLYFSHESSSLLLFFFQ